jgi:CRP/FNR family cyclic AMP-dependent transcriptional regulator
MMEARTMPDFYQLQDRPLFAGVDREAFDKFARVASYQEFQPGEVIIREGEQKNALLVIEKGQVEVFKEEISLYADDQKVATLSGEKKFGDIFRGDILGEMSLIDVEPASASVRAVTEVGIWSMDRVDFAAVLRKDLTTYIVIITNIARVLSRRLREAGKQLL